MKVLVTGVAGFIGGALAVRLLERGDEVYGIDNLNDYYDVNLKQARLGRISGEAGFTFQKLDICDRQGIEDLLRKNKFDVVAHLAAQAGVRYSIENPYAYIDANFVGFGNILEGCRRTGVNHLVFASSSSVYGANQKLPFSEHDNVDHPVSLYAASKKANELMAHSYAHLYRLPCTGLRFFTVYGPWGRPDMALFKFTQGILEGKPIPVFNRGQMMRDFSYIDDIVEGVVRTIDSPPALNADWENQSRPTIHGSELTNREYPDPATSSAPYKIYNIGNNRPVELLRYIEVLEQCLGKKAQMDLLPMQEGDVPATYADIDCLAQDTGFAPKTPVETGVAHFVDWYKEYYGIA